MYMYMYMYVCVCNTSQVNLYSYEYPQLYMYMNCKQLVGVKQQITNTVNQWPFHTPPNMYMYMYSTTAHSLLYRYSSAQLYWSVPSTLSV